MTTVCSSVVWCEGEGRSTRGGRRTTSTFRIAAGKPRGPAKSQTARVAITTCASRDDNAAITSRQGGFDPPDFPGGTFWRRWVEFVREEMLETGMISPEDMGFFRVVDSVDEAAKEIEGFYRVFHSYRYVGDDLVIRLRYALHRRS